MGKTDDAWPQLSWPFLEEEKRGKRRAMRVGFIRNYVALVSRREAVAGLITNAGHVGSRLDERSDAADQFCLGALVKYTSKPSTHSDL
jgi:hypothetical protein